MIQVRRTPLLLELAPFAARAPWSRLAIRWLEPAYWLAAIGLGAAQAWVCRFQPSTIDAVSYLDIGDAYMHGRWHDAINGYWNPLYSWILGGTLTLVPHSARLEFPIAKLVDFVLYIAALIAFRWFLKGLCDAYADASARGPAARARIPAWAWVIVGYTAFLWSSLRWITITSSTPDMCGTAIAYAAWGLLLRLDAERRFQYSLLGGVLALGYFSRTPMFAVAAVILVLAAWQEASAVRRRGVMTAAFVFLAVTAPFITAISYVRGHPTVGDNARLNHAWLANPGSYIIPNRHWQGGPAGHGSPRHASRMIWDAPATFEFAEPIGGTYPPWTDPSYWYDGLAYRFDARAEWRSLSDNARFYYELFGRWLLLAFAIALLGAGDRAATLEAVFRNARYWAPAAVGLFLYLIAAELPEQWNSAQPPARYIAVFVVLLGMTLMASLRFRSGPAPGLRQAATIGLVLVTIGALARLVNDRVDALRQPPPTPPWSVAAALQNSGVVRGTLVATIGSPARHVPWARLDRVRIIAEVPKDSSFWAKSPALQGDVLLALEHAGAQVVVSPEVPPSALTRGWRLTGADDYGVFWLGAASGDRAPARAAAVSAPGGRPRGGLARAASHHHATA
jgi:hypothetical protein